ncbi:MAG TPA: DUF3429 domain-containing protein [Acetobacteraceae bacterium]|jgi:hypothetical protein
MPPLIILFSILGLLPYVLLGLVALGPHVASANHMLSGFIAWSAMVLAFAGGVHWGFGLRESNPQSPWQGTRISLSVLALIIGWLALVLPLVAPAWLALLMLIIGYIGALFAEHRAGRRNMLPPRYLWLRTGFTVIATAMLITVLTLRLLGQTIVL